MFLLHRLRIILCMCPANERWYYNVPLSVIGYRYTQNGSRWTVMVQSCHNFTHRDTRVVMTYVNLWPDWIFAIKIRTKDISDIFELWVCKSFVKQPLWYTDDNQCNWSSMVSITHVWPKLIQYVQFTIGLVHGFTMHFTARLYVNHYRF